jgi:hypothetical protein
LPPREVAMPFFGRSKANLLEQLQAQYALEKAAPPPNSALMDDWWEGTVDGRTIAFQAQGRETMLFAGEVVEITEIYLVRIDADAAEVPPGTRLDRIVGAEGAVLAARFFLGAHPRGSFDYPQLRLPALRDGIARLSDSVRELSVFDNFRGLSLRLDERATPETVAADLGRALAMLAALEAGAT